MCIRDSSMRNLFQRPSGVAIYAAPTATKKLPHSRKCRRLTRKRTSQNDRWNSFFVRSWGENNFGNSTCSESTRLQERNPIEKFGPSFGPAGPEKLPRASPELQ